MKRKRNPGSLSGSSDPGGPDKNGLNQDGNVVDAGGSPSTNGNADTNDGRGRTRSFLETHASVARHSKRPRPSIRPNSNKSSPVPTFNGVKPPQDVSTADSGTFDGFEDAGPEVMRVSSLVQREGQAFGTFDEFDPTGPDTLHDYAVNSEESESFGTFVDFDVIGSGGTGDSPTDHGVVEGHGVFDGFGFQGMLAPPEVAPGGEANASSTKHYPLDEGGEVSQIGRLRPGGRSMTASRPSHDQDRGGIGPVTSIGHSSLFQCTSASAERMQPDELNVVGPQPGITPHERSTEPHASPTTSSTALDQIRPPKVVNRWHDHGNGLPRKCSNPDCSTRDQPVIAEKGGRPYCVACLVYLANHNEERPREKPRKQNQHTSVPIQTMDICGNANCGLRLILEKGVAPHKSGIAIRLHGTVYCNFCGRHAMDHPGKELRSKKDCDSNKSRLRGYREHYPCGNPVCSWNSRMGHVWEAAEVPESVPLQAQAPVLYVGDVKVCLPCYRYDRDHGSWRSKADCDDSVHRFLVLSGGSTAPDAHTLPSIKHNYQSRHV